MLLQTKATKAIASMPPDHCLGAPVEIYNFPLCAICLYQGENALVPCPFKKNEAYPGLRWYCVWIGTGYIKQGSRISGSEFQSIRQDEAWLVSQTSIYMDEESHHDANEQTTVSYVREASLYPVMILSWRCLVPWRKDTFLNSCSFPSPQLSGKEEGTLLYSLFGSIIRVCNNVVHANL